MGLYFEKGWDDPSNHESSVTKSGIEAIFDHWDANGHHDMRDKARKGRVDLFRNGEDVKVLKGIHLDGRGLHITVEYWFDVYHIYVRKDYSGYYHATEVSKSRWL